MEQTYRKNVYYATVEWSENQKGFIANLFKNKKRIDWIPLRNKDCMEHAEAEAAIKFPEAVFVNGVCTDIPDFWK